MWNPQMTGGGVPAVTRPVAQQGNNMGTMLQNAPNLVQITAPSPQQTANPQNGQSYSFAPSQAQIDAAAAAKAAQQRAITTNGINSAYTPVTANFDAMQNDLDRSRDVSQEQINHSYDTQRAGIDLSNQEGTDNLNRSQGSLDYTKASGLRDLGNNIQSAMQSRLNQIGSMGAGSSSAGYGAAMALHGIESNSRQGIFEQAGDQQGQLDLQRAHMGKEYEQSTNQLNDWKSGQIAQIVNTYLTNKGQIDRMRAGADQSKQAALSASSLQMAQNAAAQLAAVQANSAGLTHLTPNVQGAADIGNRYAPTLAGYHYDVQGMTGVDPTISYSGGTNQNNSSFPMAYRVGRNDQQTY